MRAFLLLDRLHHTAEGIDGLPAWFLRTAAPGYSAVIAHLINLSIKQSTVPVQWKTAVIRPVAKVTNPQSPSDYRPISIVPVLSRMVERQIVQTYIYPAFQSTSMKPLLTDQFAFRPTGSTTAALIVILQHVNNLLKTNPYVSLTSLDFTKAFDFVRHSDKLATLELPDEVYNWIIDYLQDRKHATRYGGLVSTEAAITASIVQGSGVGLSEYDSSASDLHPLNASNIFVKFADDTYRISGAATCHTITDEIEGVHRWTTKNNLGLNSSKSREMLIVRGGRWRVPHPPPLGNGILRVDHMKTLGVTIRSDLKMTTHVS